MSTTGIQQNPQTAGEQTPNSEKLHRLAVEAGKYLGLSVGEPLPVEELYLQAEANGYDREETTTLLEREGYGSAESLPVPPQGDAFGKLWRVEDSALDNTVASAKNSPSPDSTDSGPSRNACSPSPELGEPVEPLDGGDFLALQEPVALDSGACHPEYVEEGEPLTAGEAVERYVEERHGESTSANRHGFERGRQWHDRRNYARGKEMDRQLLAEYENPTTALLSLRVERTVPNRVSLLRELSSALEPTLDALRYRMDKHAQRYEWLLVLAGTRQYATPHAHIYVIAEDAAVPRGALQPVVQRFVESCEYAPADMRGNSPEGGTVRIRGTAETDTIPRTPDGGSAGATYTLAQLAHLPAVDEMDFDALLWASTVRASEGIHHFRKSSYDVWGEGEEEPEPEEAVEDFPANTVLSRPT